MSFLKKYAPSLEGLAEASTSPEEAERLRTEIIEDRAEVSTLDEGIADVEVTRDALAETQEQVAELAEREAAGEEVAQETIQSLSLAVRNALRITYGRELENTPAMESHYSLHDINSSISRHLVSLEEAVDNAKQDAIDKKSSLLQRMGRSFIDLFRDTKSFKTEIKNIDEEIYELTVDAAITKAQKEDIKGVAINGKYKNVFDHQGYTALCDAAKAISEEVSKYITQKTGSDGKVIGAMVAHQTGSPMWHIVGAHYDRAEAKKANAAQIDINKVYTTCINVIKPFKGKTICAINQLTFKVESTDEGYTIKTEDNSDATSLPTLKELHAMVDEMVGEESVVNKSSKMVSKIYDDYGYAYSYLKIFRDTVSGRLDEDAAMKAKFVLRIYEEIISSIFKATEQLHLSMTDVERYASDIVRHSKSAKITKLAEEESEKLYKEHGAE